MAAFRQKRLPTIDDVFCTRRCMTMARFRLADYACKPATQYRRAWRSSVSRANDTIDRGTRSSGCLMCSSARNGQPILIRRFSDKYQPRPATLKELSVSREAPTQRARVGGTAVTIRAQYFVNNSKYSVPGHLLNTDSYNEDLIKRRNLTCVLDRDLNAGGLLAAPIVRSAQPEPKHTPAAASGRCTSSS